MTASRGGRIITFYSYKGGTGRTMALANVAWILAANGKRVLVVDWDLEAPGLHRFYLPFMSDPDLRESDGLVDMVSEYIDALPKQSEARPTAADLLRFADPRRQAVALQFDFDAEGCLHLLAAGRQDSRYAERVRGLDWQQFYTSFGGEAFIAHLAATMRQHYDYVLIDSRTGVADSAGICTMQMPDQVVLCFTYNRQSVEGVAAVAHSISRYAGSKHRPIELLPLPTRVIPDIEGLEDARRFAQERLGTYLRDLQDPEDLLEFWASAEVPHYPAYGFEETLATFRERPGGRNNLLSDMEWLAGQICGGEGPERLARMPSSVRERYLHRFRLRDPRRAELDEALDNDPTSASLQIRSLVRRFKLPQDSEWAAVLARALQRVAARLSDVGRLHEAVRADQEAVNIHRELAAARPDSLNPDFASALNNLALRLSAVGQHQEALAVTQEAEDLYRALAAKAPDAYRPDLAGALNNLANRLSEVGRREEALAPAQQAADLYRVLAERTPDAHRANLAMALNNLANHMSGLHQDQAALAPAQEAADLYHALSKEAPDVYQQDLAMALSNLAICLSKIGRRQEAPVPAQEAVALRRALAEQAPTAHRPGLAKALTNLSNCLSEVGQYQEALPPAEEAVAIRRELAENAPDVYRPALALSLSVMADRLDELDRTGEAVQATEEALRVIAPYFKGNPQAFVDWVTQVGNDYLRRCDNLGLTPDDMLLRPIAEVMKRPPET